MPYEELGDKKDKIREKRTVVVKGLGEHVATSAICAHMEKAGSVTAVERSSCTVFVSFTTQTQAAWAVERLNNLSLEHQSQPLQVFLLGEPGWSGPGVHREVGVESATGTKAEIIDQGTNHAHTAGPFPSRFQVSSISSKRAFGPLCALAERLDASAMRRGVNSGRRAQDDVPTFGAGFTGLYLVRLLRLWRQKSENAAALALLRIVTVPRSKLTQEMCESMSVVQTLFDFGNAQKLELMQMKALVFVPGDGNHPNTAAALCLQVPDSWRVYSIDPRLKNFETCTLGAAASRLSVVPGMLEDFAVPPHGNFDICIVLAVHCHAPLIEFWARLPSSLPALCVSLPCCGDHVGWLSEEPQAITKDAEIPSEKNTLSIYYRPPESPSSISDPI